LPEAFKWFID